MSYNFSLRSDDVFREDSNTYCWLRSANADNSNDVANLDDGNAGTDDYGNDNVGFSPDYFMTVMLPMWLSIAAAGREPMSRLQAEILTAGAHETGETHSRRLMRRMHAMTAA